MGNRAKMPLLPLVWGLWCLTALQKEGTASAAFLPSSVERLFQDFSNMIAKSQEVLGTTDKFETSVDISKLPLNYHNEEKHNKKVGNATVYSHHEIDKVTDNRTGDMIFSEKTVTSIEQVDTHAAEEKECVNNNDCQKDQFCFRSLLASQCQQCKAKDTMCWNNGECCLGYLCVWGKCTEDVSHGESGTRCDPHQEECAQGLCCTFSNSLPFPICTPQPKEGEKCQIPSGTFLALMGWGSLEAFAKPKEHCPCAQGLKCRTKRYSMISTCEKSEKRLDISNPDQQMSFFQPILTRQNKDDDYYDDFRQDGQMDILNLSRGPSSMEEISQTKGLSEDYDEMRQSSWEKDIAYLNQPEFQELKELADEMGQDWRPGFY
ncbi:dickkopf-like protein 1 [Sceloporus undulatus]|uniref:dickkopf-like protein 1 n=1 Tax=Sceloporus undulatus TaxID=8520 RepID=UPI001C4ACD07|nr:dickkopf-like protein 1 [Sceloporus undulatus]XP_042330416.1 dickkopf-like protein 1 [Sceloporus undulatus]